MKRILFYSHAGSHNHGCEAIVRSTAYIIRKKINSEITIATNNIDKDNFYIDKETDLKFIRARDNFLFPNGIWRYVDAFFSRTIKKIPFLKARNSPLFIQGRKCDLCISIGGDNYSESNGIALSNLDMALRKHCKVSVLWGCSLDEKKFNPTKLKNLKEFSLITARESITYESLLKHGITNVKLFPDPAFVLPADQNITPCFQAYNTVGINISPLIQRFQKDRNIILENYVEMILYILESTTMDIALIPHVVWPETASDIVVLQLLKSKLPQSERIKVIEDCNCMKLKGYISQCRFFVCARTHASIAAYSTCVPTLVIGYSVKAKGIPTDIFGNYNNYVIPVQDLREKQQLKEAFCWLQANEKAVKNHLEQFMPEYIERAWQAGDELKRVLEKNEN